VAKELSDVSLIEKYPGFEGRTILMILTPDLGRK